MQESKQPLTVGLYFSLGHSSVVVALTLRVVIAASLLKPQIGQRKVVGGTTGVSALFLFALAIYQDETLRDDLSGLVTASP